MEGGKKITTFIWPAGAVLPLKKVSGWEFRIEAVSVRGVHIHIRPPIPCGCTREEGQLFKDCNLECFQPEGLALFHVTNIK